MKPNEQATIWDFYKPRHTHAWNMLVLSWRTLEKIDDDSQLDFEVEYHWENFILRLWLYRTTIRTLVKLQAVSPDAQKVIAKFDNSFDHNGINGLKALRDMIEHFDDYAANRGRGPASRGSDLDPWRKFTPDRYERGQFILERQDCYSAAIKLRSDAKQISDKFIDWYKTAK